MDELQLAFEDLGLWENDIRDIVFQSDDAIRCRELLQLLRGDHPRVHHNRGNMDETSALRAARRCLLLRMDANWMSKEFSREWVAMDALGLRTDYFDVILRTLEDEPFPDFKKHAVRILLKLNPQERAGALVTSVLRNPDPWVRVFALEGVDARAMSPEGRRAVMDYSLDPDPRVREIARRRLRDICGFDKDAFRMVIVQYDASLDPTSRAQFLACLCERPKSPEALSRLRAVLLATERPAGDEELLRMAIALVGTRRISDEDLKGAVRSRLSDPSPNLRQSAIAATAWFGTSADLDALRERATREADRSCRIALEKAIQRLEAGLSDGR